jgi:hypothetical protein
VEVALPIAAAAAAVEIIALPQQQRQGLAVQVAAVMVAFQQVLMQLLEEPI